MDSALSASVTWYRWQRLFIRRTRPAARARRLIVFEEEWIMVLFPNEWITGPNEVRDRVLVFQRDRRRAGGGDTPSEMSGPCLTGVVLLPDSAVIERPAPAEVTSAGGAAARRDPPPGGSPRADPADENR
jgi:hypothetical protein